MPTQHVKDINTYAKATAGYISIALLCGLTGISIRTENFDKINLVMILSLLFIYILFISAYLVNREVLLEKSTKPNIKDNSIKTSAFQFPGFILLGSIIIASFISYISIDKNIISIAYLYNLLYLFLISFIPFIFIFCRNRRLFRLNKINRAYSFAESVLIPALSLCIISFSFGWSLSGNNIDLIMMTLITSFTMILFVIIYLNDSIINIKTLSILSLYIFSYLFFIFIFFDQYIDVFLTAIILSLSLGVAETTKRIYIAKENKRFISKYKNIIEDYDFYYKGATLAGVTLPLLLSLIGLVNNFSMIMIYVYILFQLVHIFWIIKKSSINKTDFNIALILGSLLPLFIMISPLIKNIDINIISNNNNTAYGFLVGAFIALVAILLNLAKNHLKTFSHYKYFTISLGLMMITSAIYAIIKNDTKIMNNFNTLIFLSIILYLAVSILNFYGYFAKIIKEKKESND